ncbi:MAG: hypothetical protein MK160_13120, partial [Rhodobacteraceae bacterium]|nr:hypothetical protein [Paracoccaceae bacterium]
GTIVNKRNHSEVVDLYKAWVVPDRPETERAVHRGIGVDFAMSEDITQKILAERDGLAQNAVLKRNGCQTVYSACRNRVLLTATWVLNTFPLLPGPTPFFDRTRREAFVAQHHPFIGVMRRRETHEASQTVEGLLQSALRRRARALAS